MTNNSAFVLGLRWEQNPAPKGVTVNSSIAPSTNTCPRKAKPSSAPNCLHCLLLNFRCAVATGFLHIPAGAHPSSHLPGSSPYRGHICGGVPGTVHAKFKPSSFPTSTPRNHLALILAQEKFMLLSNGTIGSDVQGTRLSAITDFIYTRLQSLYSQWGLGMAQTAGVA